MRRYLTIAVAGSAALAAACAETQTEEFGDAATEEMTTETAEPAPGLEEAEASAAPLGVATLEGVGAYLTDARGRALYLLEGEPEGESACNDACAQEWPPYVVTGSPATAPDLPEGVSADLIGTLERSDGRSQVTYNGHALYYYHDDAEPGQTAGHDVTDEWGEWYLLRPAGVPLEADEETGGEAQDESA